MSLNRRAERRLLLAFLPGLSMTLLALASSISVPTSRADGSGIRWTR